MTEIVATEKSYLDSLEKLLQMWMDPLESSANKLAEQVLANTGKMSDEAREAKIMKLMDQDSSYLITLPFYKTLFSNIRTIVSLNQKFYGELKAKNKSIGELFSQYAPFFKMYNVYVNNYDEAAKVLDTLLHAKQYKSFQAFHEQKRNDPKSHGHDLQSYLIMPVQRIPRYKLLLSELISNTDENDPSISELKNALEKISQVAIAMNQDMKNVQKRDEILKLQSKFVPNMQLVSPGRILVHKGQLSKMNRREGYQNYLFVLFNDLVLYANTLGWKLILQLDVPIDPVFKVCDLQGVNMLFLSSSKSFVLSAKDEKDKNEWMARFKEVLVQNKMRAKREDAENRPRAFPEYLELKPLYSWTTDDVVIWSLYHDFDDYVQTFSSFHIDGKRLSRLNDVIVATDMRLSGTLVQSTINEALSKLFEKKPVEMSLPAPQFPEDASNMGDFPRFARITEAVPDSSEKEESKKIKYTILLSWKKETVLKKKCVKTYFDFELFEKDVRMRLFPTETIKLKPSSEFLYSFDQKSILERYLQGLTSIGIRSMYENLARFLNVSVQDLDEAFDFDYKLKNTPPPQPVKEEAVLHRTKSSEIDPKSSASPRTNSLTDSASASVPLSSSASASSPPPPLPPKPQRIDRVDYGKNTASSAPFSRPPPPPARVYGAPQSSNSAGQESAQSPPPTPPKRGTNPAIQLAPTKAQKFLPQIPNNSSALEKEKPLQASKPSKPIPRLQSTDKSEDIGDQLAPPVPRRLRTMSTSIRLVPVDQKAIVAKFDQASEQSTLLKNSPKILPSFMKGGSEEKEKKFPAPQRIVNAAVKPENSSVGSPAQKQPIKQIIENDRFKPASPASTQKFEALAAAISRASDPVAPLSPPRKASDELRAKFESPSAGSPIVKPSQPQISKSPPTNPQQSHVYTNSVESKASPKPIARKNLKEEAAVLPTADRREAIWERFEEKRQSHSFEPTHRPNRPAPVENENEDFRKSAPAVPNAASPAGNIRKPNKPIGPMSPKNR
jgi:hypothetical protein